MHRRTELLGSRLRRRVRGEDIRRAGRSLRGPADNAERRVRDPTGEITAQVRRHVVHICQALTGLGRLVQAGENLGQYAVRLGLSAAVGLVEAWAVERR